MHTNILAMPTVEVQFRNKSENKMKHCIYQEGILKLNSILSMKYLQAGVIPDVLLHKFCL